MNRAKFTMLSLLAAAIVATVAIAATTPGTNSIKLVPSGSQTVSAAEPTTAIASNTSATYPADPGAVSVYCNGALDIHWGASCPTSTPIVSISANGNTDARGIDPASCIANGQSFVPVNLRLDFTNPNVHAWYPTVPTLQLNIAGADQQFVVFQSGTNVGTAVSCFATPQSQG